MATYQDLQNEEKTLTQKLQEKRANYDQANQVFGDRASAALKLGGQAINPADVFSQFSSFQRAGQEYVSPLETQLATLRNQQMQDRQLQLQEAQAGLQFNPETGLLESTGTSDPFADLSPSELLKLREDAKSQGGDTTKIDEKLSGYGIDMAQADADAQESKQELIDLVEELKDLNTSGISGFWKLRSKISGTKAQKAKAKFEQLISKLSLENRQMLKGTGTISDFEAKMLEKAATSLNTSLSDKDFKAGIEELYNSLTGTTALDGTFDADKILDEAGF